MARTQLQLGTREQALDYLEKAIAGGRGSQDAFRLKSDPRWEPLQAESRFYVADMRADMLTICTTQQ